MLGRTIAQILTEVERTFPRKSLGWQNHFNASIEEWIYDLCDFPYWFLVQRASPDFAATFPIATPSAIPLRFQRWCGSGWLKLQALQSRYVVAAPFEEAQESNSQWWGVHKASSIERAVLFTPDGNTQLHTLEVTTETNFSQSGPLVRQGPPVMIAIRTTEAGSQFVVWPRPDQEYLLAVDWVMRECPIYVSPSDNAARSKFANFAPRAVILKALSQMANWFDEEDMRKKFEAELWGAPLPKGRESSQEYGGVIGKLRQETRDKSTELEQVMQFYPSQRAAIGRPSVYRRDPRYLPPGFGYWL